MPKYNISEIRKISEQLSQYSFLEFYQIIKEKQLYQGKEAGFRALLHKNNIPYKKENVMKNTNISNELDYHVIDLQPSIPCSMVCDCCKQKTNTIHCKYSPDKAHYLWQFCSKCFYNKFYLNNLPTDDSYFKNRNL